MSMHHHVSPTAYVKVLAHLAKYSASSVGGIVTGRVVRGGGVVEHMDAFPLFHTTVMPPMLKVALSLIEEHCSKCDMTITGYYQANSDASYALGPTAKAVGDRLATNQQEAVVFMVDAEKMLLDDEHALKCYSSVKGTWSALPSNQVLVGAAALQAGREILTSNNYSGLVDLDSHLDDPKEDWTNPMLAVVAPATQTEAAARTRADDDDHNLIRRTVVEGVAD